MATAAILRQSPTVAIVIGTRWLRHVAAPAAFSSSSAPATPPSSQPTTQPSKAGTQGPPAVATLGPPAPGEDSRQWRVPNDPEASHAARLDSEAFEFLYSQSFWLTSNKNPQYKSRKVSLWQHIQSYGKRGYEEKKVLLDPAAEEAVADAIERHSERGKETQFLDADGGCGGVARALLTRGAFQSARIFIRDERLRPLQDWALRERLWPVADRVHFAEVNLPKIASDFIGAGREYLSPLYDQQETSTDWETDEPPYTLYGTATHGLVKYLTTRCLHRDSLLSEFFKGRPEFFLVVSARTLMHLTSDVNQKMLFRPQNILFQLVFDYEPVLRIPRESYFPWRRKAKLRARAAHYLHELYNDHDDYFYLVRMRPKKEVGLTEGATLVQLQFLVHSLYRNKDVRLIPLLERWLPGVGEPLIRNSGYNVYTTTGQVPVAEVVSVLNVMAAQPHFSASAFQDQVEHFQRSLAENSEQNMNDNVEKALAQLRREFRT